MSGGPKSRDFEPGAPQSYRDDNNGEPLPTDTDSSTGIGSAQAEGNDPSLAHGDTRIREIGGARPEQPAGSRHRAGS